MRCSSYCSGGGQVWGSVRAKECNEVAALERDGGDDEDEREEDERAHV